jgi:hypothetical protein
LVVPYEVVDLVEAEPVGFADLDRHWAQHFDFSEMVTCHDGALRLPAVVPDTALTGLVSGYQDVVEEVVVLADVHYRVVHTESAVEQVEDVVECPLGDGCTLRLEEVDSEELATELEHPTEVLEVH